MHSHVPRWCLPTLVTPHIYTLQILLGTWYKLAFSCMNKMILVVNIILWHIIPCHWYLLMQCSNRCRCANWMSQASSHHHVQVWWPGHPGKFSDILAELVIMWAVINLMEHDTIFLLQESQQRKLSSRPAWCCSTEKSKKSLRFVCGLTKEKYRKLLAKTCRLEELY